MSDVRERLIRECFEHERNFHYHEYRNHHWNASDIVAACPDPEVREDMLRGFWNQESEQRFPEYRAAVSGLSLAELETEREQWLDRLSCLSVREYQEILAEASHHSPANDNERGLER